MIISETIRHNINWICIQGKIIEKAFSLKNLFLTPGWKIRKLGHKKRSSFSLEVDIVYKGYYRENESTYLLFTPSSSNTKVKNLFDEYNWYICLMYVNDEILLSQSGKLSFYDIRL